ncbi:MAG: MFS transporter [Deltaproteobacteria bacterium]|nr:MFS transporter [Deltaproteobacteria bacterium]
MNDAADVRGVEKGLFWGWYVVAGAFLILAINYGARYSFGVFVKPMAAEYNWSRSVISAGMSTMILAYGIGGIFAGKLADRIAPRWIITAGAGLMATGLFLTALIREPWQFYLSYGVFGGLGAACLGVVVCNSSVGKWFVRKRGLAIGIASIGVGAGTMATVPLAGYVVKVYGWQPGFASIGVFVLIIGVGLSQWLMGKTKPEDYGLLPDGGKAEEGGPSSTPSSIAGRPVQSSIKKVLRDTQFRIMVICYSLAVMAEMSTMVHQVAYALDRQIDKVAAASSLGIIGLASIFGRFFFGWLCDRVNDAKYAAALGFFIMAVGMFLLLETTTVTMLFIYALLFGFGYGSMTALMPFLLAERFGRHILGASYGMQVFFVMALGGTSGPMIAGYIFDLSGSYINAWILNLSALVFATFLILTLKKPGKESPAGAV